MTVPADRIVKAIEGLLRFPFPQVCRHLVAADLLSLLEECGASVSEELAHAVVRAEDEEALDLLPALKESVL